MLVNHGAAEVANSPSDIAWQSTFPCHMILFSPVSLATDTSSKPIPEHVASLQLSQYPYLVLSWRLSAPQCPVFLQCSPCSLPVSSVFWSWREAWVTGASKELWMRRRLFFQAPLLPLKVKKKKKQNQKGNSWNRDQQRKRKRKFESLLQTQTGKKRYMTEKYIVYGFGFCSSREVFRGRSLRQSTALPY